VRKHHPAGNNPEREESAGKPTNGKAQLPNGKTMTREDIIRMAIDAGATGCANPDKWGILEISYENLERFAALVAEHMTKEKSEPVGKFAKFTDGVWREVTDGSPGVPLYAAPRQWVGLTDEELSELSASGLALWELWKAIEDKLKEKNT
jgi:hypothetical protein